MVCGVSLSSSPESPRHAVGTVLPGTAREPAQTHPPAPAQPPALSPGHNLWGQSPGFLSGFYFRPQNQGGAGRRLMGSRTDQCLSIWFIASTLCVLLERESQAVPHPPGSSQRFRPWCPASPGPGRPGEACPPGAGLPREVLSVVCASVSSQPGSFQNREDGSRSAWCCHSLELQTTGCPSPPAWTPSHHLLRVPLI